MPLTPTFINIWSLRGYGDSLTELAMIYALGASIDGTFHSLAGCNALGGCLSVY